MQSKNSIEDLFKNPTVRKFSVSIDDEHHVKRKVTLSYLFLTIADPDGCSQTLYLWLPHWSVFVTQSSDHATLNLQQKIGDQQKRIKIKSKNIEVITTWNSTILKNLEESRSISINNAQFSAHGTIDGAAIQLKLIMTPTQLTVVDKDGRLYYEVERGLADSGAFIPDDMTARLMLKNEFQTMIIKLKNDMKLGAAMLMINSKPPEMKAENLIAIDDTVIPDFDMSFSDLLAVQNTYSTKSAEIFDIDDSKTAEKQADTIIVDETDPDIIKANLRRKYEGLIEKMSITQNINPAEIFEEIASQHKRPTITVQPCDKYEFPVEKETRPLFAMNDYVFKASKPLVHVKSINLNTDFNISDAKERLSTLGNIPKFNCPSTCKSYIDIVKSTVKSSEWSERPLLAAGILLQGRKVDIETIGREIQNVIFTVYEIQILVRNKVLSDKEGIVDFFNKMFQENVAYTFFKTLEYAHEFKSIVYNSDALVNTPGFCDEIADLFDSPVSPVKFSEIPFEADIVPHVRVASAVQRLRTFKHIDSIERTDDDEINSFDQIIFSLSYLLNDGPKTQLKNVWNDLYKSGNFANVAEEELSDEEKAVLAFLQMISSNTISQYLVERSKDLKMIDRVSELILTAAQLVDINRSVLIANRGTIIEKTTEHVLGIFNLLK